MTLLTVHHVTDYRYDRPVLFGEHRLMMRPRDSHDLRLKSASLAIEPAYRMRYMHDVFGNSIARVDFSDAADRLTIESSVKIDHFGLPQPDYEALDDSARRLPFAYSPADMADLGECTACHHIEADDPVHRWAREMLGPSGEGDTWDVLMHMNRAVRQRFDYETREAHGTQLPAETLARGVGSCRDFALYLMEAARALGLGARFVSGYLYDPAMDAAIRTTWQPIDSELGAADFQGATFQGAGSTHAWVQIFLPGAGWVEFDPTNGIAGGANLVRVAVARSPEQAVPVSGSYYGPAEAFQSLSIAVTVLAEAERYPVALNG